MFVRLFFLLVRLRVLLACGPLTLALALYGSPYYFGMAVLNVLFFFSLALFPVAVSTYCSKRHVAAILISLQIASGTWSSTRKKVSSNDRTLSFATIIFVVFGIALNFAFIIYATHLCHSMDA